MQTSTKGSTTGWVIGIIVVVIIVLGAWWWIGTPAPAAAPDLGTTATSTAATSTTNGSPAVNVQDKSSSTIASIIASLPDASTFNSYYTSTGVAATVTGKGPYTVFVPINNAFAILPKGTISNLSAADKKRLVQYHVVSGRALDIDATSNGSIAALSKDMLNFNVNLKTLAVQVDSSFAIQEIKASNGVIYLITGVLLPPQKAQ